MPLCLYYDNNNKLVKRENHVIGRSCIIEHDEGSVSTSVSEVCRLQMYL